MVEFDPKVTGRMSVNRARESADAKSAADAKGRGEKTKKPTREARAMEKPQLMAAPDSREHRPDLKGGPRNPSQLQKSIQSLKQNLKLDGPQRLTAAGQALAAAASYSMRRSRGARRQAMELCEDVIENVPDHGELAQRLNDILGAEGRVYELSGEATLQACLALIELFGDEE